MEYIAGGHPLDETSKNNKTPAYTRIIERSNLKGLRIGLPKEFFFDCLHPTVKQLYHDFIKALESMGSILVYDLDLHYTGKYYTSWRDIRLAEAAEIHLKWLNTRAYDYSDEVRDMLIQGNKNICS